MKRKLNLNDKKEKKQKVITQNNELNNSKIIIKCINQKNEKIIINQEDFSTKSIKSGIHFNKKDLYKINNIIIEGYLIRNVINFIFLKKYYNCYIIKEKNYKLKYESNNIIIDYNYIKNNSLLFIKVCFKTNYYIHYHDNGLIYKEYKFNKDIYDIDGRYLEYHDNNKIHIDYYIKNNKFEGCYIIYFQNGNKYKEINYKDNKLDGLYKEWYENGKMLLECKYSNGNLI
jgi:antitoxin component YwqK of YwqJK toxin-antitoxin module